MCSIPAAFDRPRPLCHNHAAQEEGMMPVRIIGGTARGRRLKSPSSKVVRPVSVRLRQSLFSIIAGELESADVLDLYAGVGSFGLEALSRGAARCIFVERHAACAKALRANIEELGFGDRSKLLRTDALGALGAFAVSGDEFDVTFVDPPYEMTDDARISGRIFSALDGAAGKGIFRNGALVMLRKRLEAPAAKGLKNLELEESRAYSHSEVLFFRPRSSA